MSSFDPFGQDPRTAGLVVVAAALRLILVVVTILGTRRSRSARDPWIVAGLAALSVLAVSALVVAGIHAGRIAILEALEGIDPSQKAVLLPRCGPGCSIANHRFLGGIALVALGVLGAVCSCICWGKHRPAGRARRLSFALACGLGCTFAAAGGLLVHYQLSMIEITDAVAGVDPSMKLELLLTALDELPHPELPVLGACLLLTGIAAVMALVSRRGVDGPPLTIGPRSMAAGAIALCLGGAAFSLTRGHAADLASSPPVKRGPAVCWEHPVGAEELRPPAMARSSRPLERGLRIEISRTTGMHGAGEILADGMPVALVADLVADETPRGAPIPALVEALSKPDPLDRSSKPLVRADHRTPVKVLEHIIASTAKAGHTALQLVSAAVKTLKSRVLGDLKKTGCYDVVIRTTTSSPLCEGGSFPSPSRAAGSS